MTKISIRIELDEQVAKDISAYSRSLGSDRKNFIQDLVIKKHKQINKK